MTAGTTLFHAVAFGQAIFTLIMHVQMIEDRMNQSYGGHWKFITYLNLYFQIVTYTMCLACDICTMVGISAKHSKFSRMKDFFVAVVGFPVAAFVSLMFWSLYLINRELVFPKAFDEIIPVWLNHMLHTSIIIFMLGEMLITTHEYPKRKSGVKVLIFLALAYLSWIIWVYCNSGIWAYPILGVLNGTWFVVFIVAMLSVISSLYVLGEMLHRSEPMKTSEKED